MKISGFTIVKNARKFNYPVRQSIESILPICDEFIVNVGDSDDDTLDIIKQIKDPKIRIIQTQWQAKDGCHFTRQGYGELAKQVASTISDALSKKTKDTKPTADNR